MPSAAGLATLLYSAGFIIRLYRIILLEVAIYRA